MLRKLTADDEFPDCGQCEYVCGSGLPCTQCGPEYGWNSYTRWVDDENESDFPDMRRTV